MKKVLFLLAVCSSLFAQEPGSGSTKSAQSASSNDWVDWVFAGSAAITITAGVLAVSLNTGESAQAH
jgi:hypothetical protein